MASTAWKADRGTTFYLAAAGVGVAATLAGFSTTYFMPVAGSRFDGPVVAHIHGWLFFAWIALVVAQPALVRRGKSRVHRKLGLVALPLALAMAASGIGVGVYAVRRDLAAGMGESAYSSLIGVVMAMSVFLAYVGIAVALRKRPDWHKRIMLLATVAILWPAWFRLRHIMPWIPKPDITLAVVVADALIVAAMLRDRLKFGRVHPAYLIFGLGLIAEHIAEVMLVDSAPWRAVAKAIYLAIA